MTQAEYAPKPGQINYLSVLNLSNTQGPNFGLVELLEQIEFLSTHSFRDYGKNNAPHITFATDREDVAIPDHLLAKYPQQITLAIQHQFDQLDIGRDRFSVRMWFNKKPYTISVPYNAIVSVNDPKQEIGLEFNWGQQVAPTKPAGPPPARKPRDPNRREPGEDA